MSRWKCHCQLFSTCPPLKLKEAKFQQRSVLKYSIFNVFHHICKKKRYTICNNKSVCVAKQFRNCIFPKINLIFRIQNFFHSPLQAVFSANFFSRSPPSATGADNFFRHALPPLGSWRRQLFSACPPPKKPPPHHILNDTFLRQLCGL